MPLHDLHVLPKIRDSWSYLYLEHCRIDREANAIAAHDAEGMTPIPCASLCALLLGPGTAITQAAMRILADNGCSVVWTGEEGVRCYAAGTGETRSAVHALRQARLWADPALHLTVVRRMYQARFPDVLDPTLSLPQIRGKEGLRVRAAYARAATTYGVVWQGRSVDRQDWAAGDPLNRALSAANACLNGLCHAAIVSAGYLPALGFVHTGKALSFVYDVADLYKADLTVPVAFQAVALNTADLERRVRRTLRDRFHETRLLARIVADMDRLLLVADDGTAETLGAFDSELAAPGGLWNGEAGEVAGGVNYGDVEQEEDMP